MESLCNFNGLRDRPCTNHLCYSIFRMESSLYFNDLQCLTNLTLNTVFRDVMSRFLLYRVQYRSRGALWYTTVVYQIDLVPRVVTKRHIFAITTYTLRFVQ